MMEGLAFHADKALLDTVFDGVIVINLKTLRISLANKAAAAILGFDDPDELLGGDPLKHVLPEDRQRFAGILTGPVSGNCLQAGTEMRALDRRGREIWIAARGAKMGSNGTSALVASFKDITSEKLLDTALREANDRQIRLLNTSNELILICQDWKIVFANRRLQEATGLSAEALTGMSVLDLIHPDDRQRAAECYQNTLDGESISSNRAFKVHVKGGETAWGVMRHAPVTWQGKPGMMTMIQDVTEQKRAEESLRQSEERFRQITENMLDAISLVDGKGVILYASPSHQRIVGYRPQDLVGKSVFDFVCPEDVDSVMASLEGIMERREATYQYRFRHADGHWVWGEASARLLLDDAGNASRFVIASRDITARKRAEETLRESEEKFRLLTERTNDLIFTTDLYLKNTYISPSVERILGYTPEEFSGRDITQQMTPESLELGREALLKQLALEQEPDADPGRSARFELEFYCKDGPTVWLENEVTAIRDANGNLVGIHGVARDVSERRKVQEALRASEERYRKVVENANEAITVVQDGLLKYVNPRFCEQTGYDAVELAFKPFLELVHPGDHQMLAEYYIKRQKGEEAPHVYQFRFIDKAGNTRWAEIDAVLFEWEGRLATLGLIEDITERKQAEQDLQESESRFRALSEAAEEGIAIHDKGIVVEANEALARMFRYPLSELIGMSAERLSTPESWRAIVEHMASAGTEPYEGQGVRKDGSTFWCSLVGKPYQYKGRTLRLATFRDVTDRKKAQEELQRKERFFRAVIENSTDGILVVGQDGKVMYESPGALRLLGLSEGGIVNNVLDPIHPEDLPIASEALNQVLSGVPVRTELRARHLDGSWRTIEAGLFSLLDDPGVEGIVINMRDVTERKQTEETLLRISKAVDSSGDAIGMSDAQGHHFYQNKAFNDLFGCTAEELEAGGGGPAAYADQEVAREVFNTIMGGGSWSGEVEMVSRTGRRFPVRLRADAVKDESGKVVGLVGFHTDISERKNAEEALRTSEQNYRNLFGHTLMGLQVIDAETMKTVLANESMARMLGLDSPEEMVGTEPLDYIVSEDLEYVVAELTRFLADPAERALLTFRCKIGGGRTIWVNAMANHFDYLFRPSVLLSVVDVTAAKEAELKVAESEEKNRLLIENAAEGIAVIQDGVVKFANPKCVEFTGYDQAELHSMPFLDLIHPNDRPLMARNYADRLEDKEVPNNYLFRIIDKTGNAKWLQINAVRFAWEGRPATLSMLNDVTARREAEEAVRASEEKYRGIFDESVVTIYIFDEKKHFIDTNQAGCDLLGYSREELLRMSIPDVDADPVIVVPAHQELLTGGRLINYEHRLRRKDGAIITVLNNSRPLTDSDGRIVGMQSTLLDITERNRAQQALVESEQRFRALIEGARDAIAVIDVNGKITYSSPTSQRMLNGPAQNLLTMGLSDRVHPEDAGRVSSVFESLLTSPDGTVADIELRYRRDDESWGVIEARGTNRFHDPKINGIVVNYRDITERRQAEEALRESNSRYRLLAENVSDVIYSLNVKSRQPFFSPSVTRLLGYTVGEAQSMKTKEVVSPTSYPKVMMALNSMLTGQQPGSDSRSSSSQMELELMRRDGSFVWVDVSVTLLRDADGKPAEFFGVMRDITHRKKAEEALRASEEYFRALIENAWDAIAIVDGMGKMLYESPSSARILGYEPEEIVGKNLAEFVRPEDVAEMTSMFRQFRNEPGAIVMVDAGFRHKYGHYIECEGTLQNFLHDPKINGIVANYRDVTDRRRAEEAVRTSEERFRNLVEATSDFVWEVDHTGTYTYVSPRVREVMGYEVGEIIGKSIFDFVPSREMGLFANVFRSHASRREPFTFVENSRLHKDGRVIIMESSGVPFFRDDGSLLGYRGIGRDITNKKKVEKELEDSLKKVEKTMEATIQTISYTMETRDPYTTGHQRRVTRLACAIAKAMEVPQWQIDGIRVAGLLHDIGKIAVPTEILSKPGKLSEIEFSMIRAHPKVGFDILKNVEFDWPIGRIVVQHHERLDGSGYPYGLKGEDILMEARILAVADVVEAMSSHRPYRPALGIEMALAEVARGEGTLYDPKVVEACSKVIKEQGFTFEG